MEVGRGFLNSPRIRVPKLAFGALQFSYLFTPNPFVTDLIQFKNQLMMGISRPRLENKRVRRLNG